MSETVEALLSLLNGGAVSVFGAVLSASFCGCLGDRRSRAIFWCGLTLLLIPQGAVYLYWGAELYMRFYLLLFHLPLAVLLYALTRKLLWPVTAILSAYLLCQTRRWLALLFVAFLPGGDAAQDLVALAVTLPLLLFLLRFASPAIRQVMSCPVKTQCQFGLIPAMYYVFDYLTLIDADFFSSGKPVVLEFMPFIYSVSYLMFLLYNYAEERKRQELRQIQSNLDLELSQAVQEINALRESQAVAVQYRHDLRHHLQYLSNCIANGQEERAQKYISEVCGEIEARQVRRWCENEAANLILSAFAGRAEKAGVKLDVQGTLPAFLMVSDGDLCVLLSNSLENALDACQPLARAGEECVISVRFRFVERTGKFFLSVDNPCKTPVKFQRGVPVSDRPGHGIGVQSICAIVERYGGGCQFLVEDGRFILRLFL